MALPNGLMFSKPRLEPRLRIPTRFPITSVSPPKTSRLSRSETRRLDGLWTSLCFAIAVLVFMLIGNGQMAVAQTASGSSWAIAVHGGAGSDPNGWSQEQRDARRAGLETALQAGRELLSQGGNALDAVETVIRVLEDDSYFNAGRGAVLTTKGTAELDASIMDGQTRACGAIAGVTIVKNPISLARRVMTQTPHVLLTGRGADEFAKQQNVPIVKPDYFLSYRSPNASPKRLGSQVQPDDMHYGTVGCVAMDKQGHLAAGTSTGGTAKKLPGRVGDSPIVGAGTFADDHTCAVSGTGVGEEYIRNAVAYDISAQMHYAGRSLEDAVTEIMTRRLKPGVGGIISLSNEGVIVMQHNTPGMSCGLADSTGRLETYLQRENGGRVDEASEDAIEVIRELIQKQSADWSAGDLDAFMEVYWKSEDLTFSSGGHTTRGWNATFKRYRERYPDKTTMGKTAFSDLEFLRLDSNAYQVLGTWDLYRETDPIGGRFTLIFKKIDGHWRIVHDHTSARQADKH